MNTVESSRGAASHPPDRHRHAHRRPLSAGRRRVFLVVVGVLVVCAVAAVLVLLTWDRPDDAAAGQAATTPAVTTAPLSPPAPTPTPTPTVSGAATTPEVPAAFVDAMARIGIPLDPHTGWVVAQGICVRLGQPEYDQFRLSEGVERLFPTVPDEQAHQFVAMVAESVCGL